MNDKFGDVETGVETPRKKGRPKAPWPAKFNEMKIDQSRCVYPTGHQTLLHVQGAIHAAVFRLREQGEKIKIETRSVHDEHGVEAIRIWRRE